MELGLKNNRVMKGLKTSVEDNLYCQGYDPGE